MNDTNTDEWVKLTPVIEYLGFAYPVFRMFISGFIE
jgi:hypothetical protein